MTSVTQIHMLCCTTALTFVVHSRWTDLCAAVLCCPCCQTCFSAWACLPREVCCCTAHLAAARPCWHAQQQLAAGQHSYRSHAHRWATRRQSHSAMPPATVGPAETALCCYSVPPATELAIVLHVACPGCVWLLQLYGMYVGEGEATLRDTFRRARLACPAIIFLDEADALAPRR